MRIVIDMQGAQSTGSRNRGIGRYTMAFAQAVVRNRDQHEIILALSGLFPDTIEPIRAIFDGLLPQENIRVWEAVEPIAYSDSANDWRRKSAELIREAFLASLLPDAVHITSLFEGFGDNAAITVRNFANNYIIAVTLYDLIPYIHRKPYLDNPVLESWYLEKIEHLKRADLWLAISESSRQEGISQLGLADERSFNISTDADAHFKPIEVSTELEGTLRSKYGLTRPFVMYTGGIDHRKNIEGLICAYSELPEELRNAHHLAIVCSVQPDSRHRLEQLAKKQGLAKSDVVLTGYVPDEDLIALYNICALFVFPSWHEGFGLPALEAMRCGVPVIAANTSSLPEVIGLAEALFDPHSDKAIAEALQRGLTDESFRSRVVEHGQVQATKFSWDETARRAIEAMKQVVHERKHKLTTSVQAQHRPRLAYLSPLLPERSGIASYSAELLPELARYYDIEVIVAQDDVTDPWVKAHCPVRTVQWFMENTACYQRVLYHFGNSAFHQHMFGLLSKIPGVVVLHDFYLSGVIHFIEALGYEPRVFGQQLFNSHGYGAFHERHHSNDIADVIWKYPCNFNVIQNSLGMIIHSPNSLRLASRWYGSGQQGWFVIPLLRDPEIKWERTSARNVLGLTEQDFVVCSFGMLGPTKLNHRLLQAWLDSSLSKSKNCYLIFVGENHASDYGQNLFTIIGQNCNIRITGWVDTDFFCRHLAAADLAVQLRTLSRGETSAAVLDCMNYGLATIVNANGSMADLDTEAVWMLPDEFSDQELVTALETLWRDTERRQRLGIRARKIILEHHNPARCAEQYRIAIECFYSNQNTSLRALPDAIARILGHTPTQTELIALANAISISFPPAHAHRQLLVDISELVQRERDARMVIQRVVPSILWEWLTNPPDGYRVEPVYAMIDQSYRYARHFTAGFMDCPIDGLTDEPIDYAPGDVFFGLDLQPQVQVAHRTFYQHLRRQGVLVKFTVYDLLCVQMPQFFNPGASEGYLNWLKVVAESDGAVCISQAVADELTHWVDQHAPKRQRALTVDWFHLGADLDSSAPTTGLPADANQALAQLNSRTSFLMVGTLEPRKGHTQVLDAFECLWQSGTNANLVIVGKQGWMVDTLIDRIRDHTERGKRLFWLEGISDEYLEKVYQSSTCLIAASYGEGFGLPLIEAAQHKLPIIARDIPVFREVAGKYAYYFDAESSNDLSQAIKDWLKLYEDNQHPKSDNMHWLTWQESTRNLHGKILNY